MNVSFYKVPRDLLQDIIVYLRKGTWDDVNPLMVAIQNAVAGPFEPNGDDNPQAATEAPASPAG